MKKQNKHNKPKHRSFTAVKILAIIVGIVLIISGMCNLNRKALSRKAENNEKRERHKVISIYAECEEATYDIVCAIANPMGVVLLCVCTSSLIRSIKSPDNDDTENADNTENSNDIPEKRIKNTLSNGGE